LPEETSALAVTVEIAFSWLAVLKTRFLKNAVASSRQERAGLNRPELRDVIIEIPYPRLSRGLS